MGINACISYETVRALDEKQAHVVLVSCEVRLGASLASGYGKKFLSIYV